MKGKHILKAVASGLIWGLGQVFNKQYIKALFFFLIFVLFVSIEVGSSKYLTGYDPYTKVAGKDFTDEFAEKFYKNYLYESKQDPRLAVPAFEEFYKEHSADGLSMEELIEYTATDILTGSRIKYYVLTEELKATEANKGKDRLTDLYPGEDDTLINTLKRITINFTTYQSPEGKEYYRVNKGTEIDPVFEYINVADPADVIKNITGFNQLDRKGNLSRTADYSKYYVEVIKSGINPETIRFDNIMDSTDSLPASDRSKLLSVKGINDALYNDGTTVYGYYNPEGQGGQYRQTTFSKQLSAYLLFVNQFYKENDQNDMAKLKLRIYFAMHPDEKANFETLYDNFFYDRAGFFTRGLWAIVTLGTSPKTDYYQISKLSKAINVTDLGGSVITNIYVKGHLSSFLLIKGLISTFLLFYFIIFFIWSIRDAYKTSVEYEKTHKFVKDSVYFKNLYEHAFEYIVLSPAIFIVTFISLMPIVFGFIIAFTTYNGNAADVGFFEWAKYGGFENFLKIFSFGENVGLDFGHSFWRVFLWTVIWAIFSTVTVFFGGFFQAIVINSERVPLRKFWRTLLILPWAVPALISQMVLANFFNELGVVNEFLKSIGIEQILKDWGLVGKTWAVFRDSGLPTILFLGEDHIQWVSNAHNIWFVRTMLIVINIWLGFPYYMALMSSVMAGIDKTLYEAADIDGANKNQKFRFITFPLVLFSTAPLLVMCFSGNFNNFGVIYFITQGGANKGYSSAFAGDTDILISWMYTLTVEEKYYNVASVFSIMIFFIVGSIAAWNYARTKSFQED